MPARYRDRNDLVGNLEPGETPFCPEIEVIPMRIIGDYQAELDRIRAYTNNQFYAPPRFRSAPFRHSIHRRGS